MEELDSNAEGKEEKPDRWIVSTSGKTKFWAVRWYPDADYNEVLRPINPSDESPK